MSLFRPVQQGKISEIIVRKGINAGTEHFLLLSQ